MDIKEKQIWSKEQEIVIQTLAESVAKHGCKFLEIGSWCGDSTVILGKVVQKHNGYLFCVDWWKGNVGTELGAVAYDNDVYVYFWERIKSAGLSEVVVPIRAKSDIASQIIKENSFDLVFIDADHRYDSVNNDIQQYAPFVNYNNGILCGHDCEGRISDFDKVFLETGKNLDFYESVHCGVVLAVGKLFENYSINHDVWSVRRKTCNKNWEPTNLSYPDIKDRIQISPSPIGYSSNYMIFRFGRLIYAVPKKMGIIDLTIDENIKHKEIIAEKQVNELEQKINEKIFIGNVPQLIESYKGFNLVKYKKALIAIEQSLGELDLFQIDDDFITKLKGEYKYLESDSIEAVKKLVDLLIVKNQEIDFLNIQLYPLTSEPILISSYKGFNLVRYKGQVIAVDQRVGKIDFTQIDTKTEEELSSQYKYVSTNSEESAKKLIELFIKKV
ncbi:MAG: class I SAM-dependent methyltransferase [Desulfobacterales bacterium]|nr:class I SAM-dependent methyltransferase [Desulfobacterales bacterium]